MTPIQLLFKLNKSDDVDDVDDVDEELAIMKSLELNTGFWIVGALENDINILITKIIFLKFCFKI